MAFRIGIATRDTEEGQHNGTVYVETDRHKFEVPFTFTVARGSLNTVPRELAFEPVFPVSGSQPQNILSTGLSGYYDTLGDWQKCHINRLSLSDDFH